MQEIQKNEFEKGINIYIFLFSEKWWACEERRIGADGVTKLLRLRVFMRMGGGGRVSLVCVGGEVRVSGWVPVWIAEAKSDWQGVDIKLYGSGWVAGV